MSTAEIRTFADKVTTGFNLATKKLIETIGKEDGYLVIMKDGKPVRVKARDLK